MFQPENKDFSEKHSEIFSVHAMKLLERDFQFFDNHELEKGFLPQAKGSPFSMFSQNIFADLNPDEMTKEILKQNAAMRREMNLLKNSSDHNSKGRKGKNHSIDEPKDQEEEFLQLLGQAPVLDHDRKLFVEMLYPDIHFQVDQQLIPAHRYILLTRCPAFGRMFTSGMIESQTSVIQLNDVRPATFQAFLEFIYCGEVTISDFEVAVELLNEADKYFLVELKKRIGRYLKSQISMGNVIKITNLAELHEVDQLKEAAFKFILSNSAALFNENSQNKLTDLLDSCLIQLFKKIRRKNEEF